MADWVVSRALLSPEKKLVLGPREKPKARPNDDTKAAKVLHGVPEKPARIFPEPHTRQYIFQELDDDGSAIDNRGDDCSVLSDISLPSIGGKESKSTMSKSEREAIAFLGVGNRGNGGVKGTAKGKGPGGRPMTIIERCAHKDATLVDGLRTHVVGSGWWWC